MIVELMMRCRVFFFICGRDTAEFYTSLFVGRVRCIKETAKKEADRNSRNTKSQQAETKSRDVRLNRALEEVERYKNLLNDARDSRKGGGEEQRRDLMELRSEVRVLQRQVRVARFPNPGTLLYLSAGDCCPYIAIYKTDDFL